MASTDEILFHLSQKMDALQVQMSSASEALRQSASELMAHLHTFGAQVTSGETWRSAQASWQLFTQRTADRWQHLRELAADFQPNELIEKVKFFIYTDLSTVHVCLVGAGFCAGLLVGYIAGSRRRRYPLSTRQPRLMSGVVCTSYQGLESVMLTDDLELPRIVTGTDVLVRVKAASVDRVDLRIACGYGRTLRRHFSRTSPPERPVVLGRDLAGVVEEVGSEVTCWEVGDPVWAALPFWRSGTLAEYVVLDERALARKPDSVPFERAAALPYSGTIAWNVIVDQAGLTQETTQGKRVLVHAGASSVGVIALQLVKAWGGHVTTTVSSRLVPLARMLGADDVIAHNTSDVEKELQLREKFDVVLNTVGPVLHGSCLQHCTESGLVVTAVEAALPSDRYGLLLGSLYCLWLRVTGLIRQVLLIPESWGSVTFSVEVLSQLTALVEARELQAVVEHTFDSRDADAAFQYLARGDTVGKPVIRFRPSQVAKEETSLPL